MKSYSEHINNYRPCIDGLRAIAVLSVILFHIEPNILPGGFVGVDIFFVISGFLITSLIRKSIVKGEFGFKIFYMRRIRRIFPALLVVLLFSSVLSFFIFRPKDLYSFATSLFYQLLFIQNVSFFVEGEYFIGAYEKPLLHTWSLAIEEQFYLFWPLIIWVTRKWKTLSLLVLLVSIIVFSFILNIVSAEFSPKSSFFLLPMRAWELVAGGLLAIFLERYKIESLSRNINLLGGWVGLVLILASLFLIDSGMDFPGYVAIFPVAGSLLVVAHKPDFSSSLSRLLSNKYIVHVGLLSYSLYLWHWPILVYANYLKMDFTNIILVFGIVFIIFTLSCLSYYFVEIPIRNKKILIDSKRLIIIFMSLIIFIAVLSIHLLSTQGAIYRYSRQVQPFLSASFNSRSDRCGFVWNILNVGSEVCSLVSLDDSNRKILLWGNSHADMWSEPLIELARSNRSELYLNAKNCRATADSSFCNSTRQVKIMKFIKDKEISDVVLASTWYDSYNIDDVIFEKNLNEVVAQLKSVRLWIVVDIPKSVMLDPLHSYLRSPEYPKNGYVSYQYYLSKQKDKEMKLFEELKTKFKNVELIDPSVFYCDSTSCLAGVNGEVWYSDSNHVTNTGAFIAKSAFLSIFSDSYKTRN